MKASIFLTYFLIISCRVFSQTDAINDSLINEICKTLNSDKNLADSARFREISQKHIYPVVIKIDTSKRGDAFKFISARLQRNCNEFKLMIERMYPNKGDWVHEDKKPISSLDKEICKDFIQIGKYYYLEANGDTVHLTIENNIWEDHFLDGTYSKLKFYWTGDCEFEIEFVDSNNETRKNFSRPGDKYKYQILEKDNGYYKLSVESVGTSEFYTFKVYY
jgi:hypothetical protein